jgi:hypothetical protein
MNENSFKKIIKKNQNQVLFFFSPLPIPFNFALHTWIVTSKKGKVKRWEVWQFRNQCKTSNGHVHLNLFKPWIGMRKFFFTKLRFDSKLLGKIEGAKAERIIKFIEKNAMNYKYTKKYYYIPGPNSNTFTTWILNKFPQLNVKLPWNAFGKNYKIA